MKLKKLILLSPVGLRQPNENQTYDDLDRDNNLNDEEKHPGWFALFGQFCWINRLTPFRMARKLGPRVAKTLYKGFIERKFVTTGSVKEEWVDDVLDYMYLVNVQESNQEMGIMINFNLKLEAVYPLASPEKLMSSDFPIPISIMYGDTDWVGGLESDAPKLICDSSKYKGNSENDEGLLISKLHIVPTSDHQLHFDNPMGLANSIINDVYNLKLAIPINELFEKQSIIDEVKSMKDFNEALI